MFGFPVLMQYFEAELFAEPLDVWYPPFALPPTRQALS